MGYQLDLATFKETFSVNDEGTRLKHSPGKRFKLFPYIANNNSEAITSLNSLVGRYLNQVVRQEPTLLTPDNLIAKIKEDTEIEPGMDEIFAQVVRNMFFDDQGNIRPVNLKMLSQIPCTESSACKLADYLVDVLGDAELLKEKIHAAAIKVEAQSNVLEKVAASKLTFSPIKATQNLHYQRITNAVKARFESDFSYILEARNRTRDYLIPLLEFYYFIYTAQAILQLRRFMEGDRDSCIPLYFCLEWEKTSQNRRCFSQGWNLLQEATKRIFAHAVVLEILNQFSEEHDPVDYIALKQLISGSQEEDHLIAEQIKPLTDAYRKAITDCPSMSEQVRTASADGETAAEIRFLFESVRIQFENSVRSRAYNSYADKFEEYSKKYLKRRGRSGMMLNLSEETLIFLTKICIKDQEKMRLNDVFSEFENRGVFLDNHSKSEVMHYYEKLNLIEKKSDSGDAQYVKRIL